MENILENDAKLKEYSEKLDALRKDGVNKITELRQDIAATKRNKLLDKTQREERIASDMKVLEDARIVAEKNKEEIAALTKESVAVDNQRTSIYQKLNIHDTRTLENVAKALGI